MADGRRKLQEELKRQDSRPKNNRPGTGQTPQYRRPKINPVSIQVKGDSEYSIRHRSMPGDTSKNAPKKPSGGPKRMSAPGVESQFEKYGVSPVGYKGKPDVRYGKPRNGRFPLTYDKLRMLERMNWVEEARSPGEPSKGRIPKHSLHYYMSTGITPFTDSRGAWFVFRPVTDANLDYNREIPTKQQAKRKEPEVMEKKPLRRK
jgi:hypothetical protein